MKQEERNEVILEMMHSFINHKCEFPIDLCPSCINRQPNETNQTNKLCDKNSDVLRSK